MKHPNEPSLPELHKLRKNIKKLTEKQAQALTLQIARREKDEQEAAQ